MTTSSTTVRIRGIYATAFTQQVTEAGYTVVQASPPIHDRFDEPLPDAAADVTIETTADRQGVGITGTADAVAGVVGCIGDLGGDTFTWTDETPRSGVFDGVADRSMAGGAIVDLGDGREGYLPYDAVDAYVEEGDTIRVQVARPTPPWDGDRPELTGSLRIPGGIATLEADVSRLVVDAPTEELARTTELLSTSVPDDWGVRWERRAADVGLDELDGALARAVERASALDRELDEGPTADEVSTSDEVLTSDEASTSDETVPARLARPETTTWCWFGRESRFALDGVRRSATTTMCGHHRIKTAAERASVAVDFVEALGDPQSNESASDEFPVGPVMELFGPAEGDRVAIGHGKPDGRLLVLGRGTVVSRSTDGTITVRRELTGGGTYDALDVEIEDGDVAITTFVEGRRWYPTVYRDDDGNRKGTYVNVGTPIECFPRMVRYVDLYVDVVKHADGTIERVDDDELDDAVDAGLVSTSLADAARQVATSIERAL